MPKYRIIAIDGGGVKGLFAAVVLQRLVAAYPRLVRNTDLCAGTSTGSIIALGLAAGKTPARLVSLYKKHAAHIFDDSFWDDLIDLGNAAGADYSNDNLKEVLRDEFGNGTLKGLGKRVLVPAFDLDAPRKGRRPRTWKPKFFQNYPGPGSDEGEKIVDVALRSSAAPTYFPSYQGYIDGGVVANNPSMAALAQAIDRKTGKQRLEDILLLSLSTGTEPKYIEGDDLDWGWGQWARPLVNVMIGGSMGVADYQCQRLLGDSYRRIDTYLDRGVDLDDPGDRTLRYLERAAKAVPLRDHVAWLRRSGW